jgi:CHAD domain-containing protein
MGNATTASRVALAAALRARTAEIAAAWPRAARGESRAIHRARTASRRLRELLPVIDAAAPHSGARRLRREARRLTRALGPLREFDVALDVLADEIAEESPAPPAVVTISQALEEQREHARGALRTRLEALDIDAWRTRCDNVLDSITNAAPGRAWEAALAKRLRRRALRVMTTMAAAGTLYSPEALHAVRIAAKKLRYALELARDLSNAHVNPLIGSIKDVQDCLGRIHDLHVLDQYVRGMKWPSGRRAASQGPAILLTAIEREGHEQHAAYLARRDVLRGVARQAASPITAGLTGRRRPARMKLAGRPPRLRVIAGGR